jgi:hypothetical protein
MISFRASTTETNTRRAKLSLLPTRLMRSFIEQIECHISDQTAKRELVMLFLSLVSSSYGEEFLREDTGHLQSDKRGRLIVLKVNEWAFSLCFPFV